MIAESRRAWWKYVRRYGFELCDDCGRPVGLVWTAPDELWLRIWGGPDGTLCIPCADSRMCALGLFIRWVPTREESEG